MFNSPVGHLRWKEICPATCTISFYLQWTTQVAYDFHAVTVSLLAESWYNNLTSLTVAERIFLPGGYKMKKKKKPVKENDMLSCGSSHFPKSDAVLKSIALSKVRFKTCYSHHIKDKWLTLPEPWELYGPPELRAPRKSSCNSTPESRWATAAEPRSARTSLSLRSQPSAPDWLGKRSQQWSIIGRHVRHSA